jgi:predicted RNA-binding protein with PIN domain
MAISRAQMQKEVSTGSKKMKKKLKKVDKKKNPGLSKLPTKVRNKMGYMKKGGKVK